MLLLLLLLMLADGLVVVLMVVVVVVPTAAASSGTRCVQRNREDGIVEARSDELGIRLQDLNDVVDVVARIGVVLQKWRGTMSVDKMVNP